MAREDITLISLWVHVPFVTAWIGVVMLDAFALFAPGLQEGQRLRIVQWSRPFTLIAIAVILVTGIWQTMDNPFLRVDSWSDLSRLRERTLYGDLLFWKHVFVLATFALALVNRFYLAPRVSKGSVSVLAAGGGPAGLVAQADNVYRLLQAGVVLNGIAALGALLLATRMVVELH